MFFYEDSKSKQLYLNSFSSRNRNWSYPTRLNDHIARCYDVAKPWPDDHRKCKCRFDPHLFHHWQISFIIGIVSLIGPVNAVSFFVKKSKVLGSVFYFGGITIMIVGWKFFTLAGFLMQIYGIFLLFRSFLKTAFAYM